MDFLEIEGSRARRVGDRLQERRRATLEHDPVTLQQPQPCATASDSEYPGLLLISPGNPDLNPKGFADLDAAWTPRPGLTLAAGAQNLLDRYPDRNAQGDPGFEGNSYFGIFPYSSISPFGFNGRVVYGRVEWRY